MTDSSIASTEPVVQVRNLEKVYPGPDGADARILNGLSFDIAPGEFVALTGQSGCGKTTLLRILMGLVPPSSGSVRVAGKEGKGCAHNRDMVFQQDELLPWRSALGNAALEIGRAHV